MTKNTSADASDQAREPTAGDAAQPLTPNDGNGHVPAEPVVPPLRPVVQYTATSVDLFLTPGGRAILATKKTRVLSLKRDPELELADPNVRLVLAMAAGEAMRDAIAGEPEVSVPVGAAYCRAIGDA